MAMFPLWVIERLSYWTLFAFMVIAIDRTVRGINFDMLNNNVISGKLITAITLLGVALLVLWVLFH